MIGIIKARLTLGLTKVAIMVAWFAYNHINNSRLNARCYLFLNKYGYFHSCMYCYDEVVRPEQQAHAACQLEVDQHWANYQAEQEQEERAYWHMVEVLATFCRHYGCWTDITKSGGYEFCNKHLPLPALEDDEYYPEDDEPVSTTTVYNRALSAFNGNHELAREAVSQYPGDFV